MPASGLPPACDDVEGLSPQQLAELRARLEEESPPPPGDGQAPPARPRGGHRAEYDPGSRDLVLLWCVWLLGSWGVTMAMDPSVTPAARRMVLAALLGMVLFWPALRLGQLRSVAELRAWLALVRPRRRRGPGVAAPSPDLESMALVRRAVGAVSAARALSDWLSLNVVLQLVIWPLWLATDWRVEQAAWLAGALAAWSLLTAGLVAWGGSDRAADEAAADVAAIPQADGQQPRPSTWRRTAAMALCVLLLFGEPLGLWLMQSGRSVRPAPGTAGGGWSLHISPIEVVWAITGPQADWQAENWAPQVGAVFLAAAAGWVGLAWWLRRRPG